MKAYIYITFLIFPLIGISQENSFYRSYLVVPEIHNPAYNGALPCSYFSFTDKHQWLGIKDAPSQQIASANIRIAQAQFNHNGMGIMLLNDLNGDNNASGLSFAYAKHIMVARKKGHWLSMGISASGFYKRIDDSDLIANNPTDPILTEDAPSAIQANISGGLLYHSKQFETGISFYQVLPNDIYIDKEQHTKPLAIVHAQYNYYLFKTLRIVPSVVIRYETNQHVGMDINLKYQFIDRYWAAISSRMYMGNYENTFNSLLLYLGYTYKNISLSYSADIGFTSLQARNWGGHEISLSYRICKEDCGCTH